MPRSKHVANYPVTYHRIMEILCEGREKFELPLTNVDNAKYTVANWHGFIYALEYEAKNLPKEHHNKQQYTIWANTARGYILSREDNTLIWTNRDRHEPNVDVTKALDAIQNSELNQEPLKSESPADRTILNVLEGLDNEPKKN